MHRFFDISIDSELPLPGLGRCDGGKADWTISCPGGSPDESGFEWFHRWDAQDGQELMSVARRNGDYLMRIFGPAMFRISFENNHIEAYALDDCTELTLAHLLLDQVLPRVISHQGRLVLHASAVLLNDGRAFAFSAPSGCGKSTLATAFHNAGHRVLADDCLLLERRGGAVFAVPAYSSLRLWPDSLNTLLEGGDLDKRNVTEMAHYSDKKQVLLENGAGAVAPPQPVELSALFLLNQPLESSPDEGISINPARGSAAIMAMVEAQFALDVVERAVVKRNFSTVGRVAGGVPVFALTYPRDYGVLSQVIDNIAKFGTFSVN